MGAQLVADPWFCEPPLTDRAERDVWTSVNPADRTSAGRGLAFQAAQGNAELPEYLFGWGDISSGSLVQQALIRTRQRFSGAYSLPTLRVSKALNGMNGNIIIPKVDFAVWPDVEIDRKTKVPPLVSFSTIVVPVVVVIR